AGTGDLPGTDGQRDSAGAGPRASGGDDRGGDAGRGVVETRQASDSGNTPAVRLIAPGFLRADTSSGALTIALLSVSLIPLPLPPQSGRVRRQSAITTLGRDVMFNRARSLSGLTARRRLFPLAAAAALLMASLMMRPAAAQQVAQYTFEDGTADGWASFFDASAPTYSTTATAAPDPDGGTGSLLTTVNYTSSGGGGGPALQINNLIPGATYTITGYVMLTPGEAASDTNLTVQRQDPGCSGGTCYDTVGTYQVPVTASAWAKIGGTYTVSTTETSLLLYAQLSPSATPTTPQSFYLDDVTITETSGPPNPGQQDNSGITTNFEDGGLDGWSQRSGANGLSNVAISNGPGGDTNALFVQSRAAFW